MIDYSNVGRNDPCPCGSGKKYKKCHYQKEMIRRSSESQAKLSDFIRPTQMPYRWYKGLTTLVNRRDWKLIYELFDAESAIREVYPTEDSFIEAARISANNSPGGGNFEVSRYHVMGPHSFIMGSRGREDRRSDNVTYELLSLVNKGGIFRILGIEQIKVAKADATEEFSFDQFETFNKHVEAERAKPLERPNVERWAIDPSQIRKVG